MAAESPVRVRIYRESNLLAINNSPDICLINADLNLYIAQILGQRKQDRSLQAGRDGLPDIDITVDDDTVHRGKDHGIAQVQFTLAQTARTGIDLGLCREHLGLLLHKARCNAFKARMRLVALRERTTDHTFGYDLTLEEDTLAFQVLFQFAQRCHGAAAFGPQFIQDSFLHGDIGLGISEIGTRHLDPDFKSGRIDAGQYLSGCHF